MGAAGQIDRAGDAGEIDDRLAQQGARAGLRQGTRPPDAPEGVAEQPQTEDDQRDEGEDQPQADADPAIGQGLPGQRAQAQAQEVAQRDGA